MKQIVEKVSFYPYSYVELSRKDWYAIIRYNTVFHKWITLERLHGEESSISEEVRKLNEDAGLITEEFIVGYE